MHAYELAPSEDDLTAEKVRRIRQKHHIITELAKDGEPALFIFIPITITEDGKHVYEGEGFTVNGKLPLRVFRRFVADALNEAGIEDRSPQGLHMDTYTPDPKLLAMAEKMRLEAQLFYTTSLPGEEWTATIIGEREDDTVIMHRREFHRDVRAFWYDEVEEELKREGVVRYVLGTEAWLGGEANPDRQACFFIAGADKLNNRVSMSFELERDAIGRTKLGAMRGIADRPEALMGDFYTLLEAHCNDVEVKA